MKDSTPVTRITLAHARLEMGLGQGFNSERPELLMMGVALASYDGP